MKESKRQLLAELFEGKSSRLRTYQRHKKQQDSPWRWVIDNRATDGTITAIDKQGNKILMSEQEFEQLDPAPLICITVDGSGGQRIPEPDEDYGT